MEIVILKIMGTAMLNTLVFLGLVGFVKDVHLEPWIKASILIVLCMSAVTIFTGAVALIWI